MFNYCKRFISASYFCETCEQYSEDILIKEIFIQESIHFQHWFKNWQSFNGTVFQERDLVF